MAEASMNAQWIVHDLIDQSEHGEQEIDSLARQQAGLNPTDGQVRLSDLSDSPPTAGGRPVNAAAMKIVYDAVLRYREQYPSVTTPTIGPQDMQDARSLVVERIRERAGEYLQELKGSQIDIPDRHGRAKTVKGEVWPRVNFPNEQVHPYLMTARDGRQWQKMIVAIPQSTLVHGIDISGFAVDRFMSRSAIDDKINGRPVTIGFKPGEPVTLFKGHGEQRETVSINDPWDLCTAVKATRTNHDEPAGSKDPPKPPVADDTRLSSNVRDNNPAQNATHREPTIPASDEPRQTGAAPYDSWADAILIQPRPAAVPLPDQPGSEAMRVPQGKEKLGTVADVRAQIKHDAREMAHKSHPQSEPPTNTVSRSRSR